MENFLSFAYLVLVIPIRKKNYQQDISLKSLTFITLLLPYSSILISSPHHIRAANQCVFECMGLNLILHVAILHFMPSPIHKQDLRSLRNLIVRNKTSGTLALVLSFFDVAVQVVIQLSRTVLLVILFFFFFCINTF